MVTQKYSDRREVHERNSFVKDGFYLSKVLNCDSRLLEPHPEALRYSRGKYQDVSMEYRFNVPVINKPIKLDRIMGLMEKKSIDSFHFSSRKRIITPFDFYCLYGSLSEHTLPFDFSKKYHSLNPEEFKGLLKKIAKDNFDDRLGIGMSSNAFEFSQLLEISSVRLKLSDWFGFSSGDLEFILKRLKFEFVAKEKVRFLYDAYKIR